MGAVITYEDNAGTNALNTDIVLQLSADGGSNYTTATLTALPDFATGIKMCKVNDLTIGTPGTSLNYKLEFANQSTGSKVAKIKEYHYNINMAYIGQNLDRFSNVEKLDAITPATATGAGPYNLTKSSVAFTPSSANTIIVSIDGVIQYGNFTVSGSTITFDAALSDSNTCDFIYHMGTGLLINSY